MKTPANKNKTTMPVGSGVLLGINMETPMVGIQQNSGGHGTRMSAANELKQWAKRLRAKADTLDALVEAAEDMQRHNPEAEAALWHIVCEAQRA
jgi:hypothetical protein